MPYSFPYVGSPRFRHRAAHSSFGKMKGAGDPSAIALSKFLNAAERRLWMNEVIHKCSRNVANPTKMVTWLKAVGAEENKYEDFCVLGRLYDPSFLRMENKILEGVEWRVHATSPPPS